MFKTFLMTFLVFAFISCGDQREKALSTLKEEVMAVHDEVMPKMGELRKVEKALRAAAEDNVDSLTFVEQANAIGDANESMMTWMRAYEPNYEGNSLDDQETYFEEQKSAIQKVRENMLTSLNEGKKLLE